MIFLFRAAGSFPVQASASWALRGEASIIRGETFSFPSTSQSTSWRRNLDFSQSWVWSLCFGYIK